MKTIKIPNKDGEYLDKIETPNPESVAYKEDIKKLAYNKRIKKVYNMPDLSREKGNPVEMIVDKIITSKDYKDFTFIETPEVVSEYETFDLFEFPSDHIVRRPSDSYFLDKNENDSKKSILLRPHTTVAWHYYLNEGGGFEELEKTGDIEVLTWGKVYRVDELDKNHHECFHQIDGFRIVEKSKLEMNQDTLKDVLSGIVKSIYGDDIEYRFNKDYFPYTVESLEVEIKRDGNWVEILGSGIVAPDVLKRLGLDPEKYNGWAFGFGIDRLAMALKGIPDIRILWSTDSRITSQWGDFKPYKSVSNLPPVYKDISILVPKIKFEKDEQTLNPESVTFKDNHEKIELQNEADIFEISAIIRDIGHELIEEVRITDIYENDDKLGGNNKSITLKITFRSLLRSLTHDEINKLYFEIREKIEEELGYELR